MYCADDASQTNRNCFPRRGVFRRRLEFSIRVRLLVPGFLFELQLL